MWAIDILGAVVTVLGGRIGAPVGYFQNSFTISQAAPARKPSRA